MQEVLSKVVHKRSYARFLDTEKRRESPSESTDRVVDYLKGKFETDKYVCELLDEIRPWMHKREVLPSMRLMWSAGPFADFCNSAAYNCAYIQIDCIPAFVELLCVLMMGVGVGTTVERRYINNLPKVRKVGGLPAVKHVVGDSTEGWMDALDAAVRHGYNGRMVEFDYSEVRPRGTRLKTKGGRASGPEPLRRLLAFVRDVFVGAGGRRLRPTEVSDIACMVADAIVSGGVRRSALLIAADADDMEMINYKNWRLGDFPKCRYRANISIMHYEKPGREMYDRQFDALVESKSGEPAFVAHNWAKRSPNRAHHILHPNACGETALRALPSMDPYTGEGGGSQFCNLSSCVLREFDTSESVKLKVRYVTILGLLQATLTDFRFLRPSWKQICDEDMLLGVDLSGQCDAPHIARDPDLLTELNRIACDTADELADHLGVARPASITVGKPNGNSSQYAMSASGFHARYSPYYLRRVRCDSHDPVVHVLRYAGYQIDPELGEDPENPETWVVAFPVKSPEGAIFRDDETAIEQLDRYKMIANTWLSDRGQNQSITVYVKPEEWAAVREWCWDNWDDMVGISFLEYDGGNYQLAPYEEITAERYAEEIAKLSDVDWALLDELDTMDISSGSQELACMAGSCEI